MVEVAPGGERLRIPIWKYVLFLVLSGILLLGILWYLLSSSYGAQNSFLESIRRYLSFFSSYHPSLKPEDNFANALRIHGVERTEAKKFCLFVSATDKDGSPAKVINTGDIGLKVTDNAGNQITTVIDRIRPLHMYTQWPDPISFASVMDYSGSMFATDLNAIESNFSELINQISLPFAAAVIKFNSRVNVVQELTSDNSLILGAISNRIKLENTALFDGIDKGVEKIQSRPHVRFVVLTTDGNDNASSMGIDEVIKRCQQHNISVFVFGFGWLEVKNLRHISDSTDGYYSYVPDSSNLNDWFKKLGQIINNIQVIEYSTQQDMNQPASVELSLNMLGTKLNRIKTW
jgi:hypothetical protein